jgi:hypothetical protein
MPFSLLAVGRRRATPRGFNCHGCGAGGCRLLRSTRAGGLPVPDGGDLDGRSRRPFLDPVLPDHDVEDRGQYSGGPGRDRDCAAVVGGDFRGDSRSARRRPAVRWSEPGALLRLIPGS